MIAVRHLVMCIERDFARQRWVKVCENDQTSHNRTPFVGYMTEERDVSALSDMMPLVSPFEEADVSKD